jgi:hypothetical protein
VNHSSISSFSIFSPLQRPASVQLNSNRSPMHSPNVTSLPPRSTPQPITSHTSLHAYWNDPNFDTQSQASNGSSSSKKRRAPRAPGQTSPTLTDQAAVTAQANSQLTSDQQHQSQESLTENNGSGRQKRKAPVLNSTTIGQETTMASGRLNSSLCNLLRVPF